MTDLDRRTLIAASLAAAVAPPLRAAAPVGTPAPWGATPSARQLAWHARERYAFVHFSINTFSDKEWGYGDESPTLFNPPASTPTRSCLQRRPGACAGSS